MRVRVGSFRERTLIGTVTFIARLAEFTPANVPTPEERAKQVVRIKVSLENAEALRPAMSADVWLDFIDGHPLCGQVDAPIRGIATMSCRVTLPRPLRGPTYLRRGESG
jgi:hypothetical protein